MIPLRRFDKALVRPETLFADPQFVGVVRKIGRV